LEGEEWHEDSYEKGRYKCFSISTTLQNTKNTLLFSANGAEDFTKEYKLIVNIHDKSAEKKKIAIKEFRRLAKIVLEHFTQLSAYDLNASLAAIETNEAYLNDNIRYDIEYIPVGTHQKLIITKPAPPAS
jgi:hypothetical protein